MAIYGNNNGAWDEVIPKVKVNGQMRDCVQVWVNVNGVFRPVWKLASFRAAQMNFNIDGGGYGRINFRTGNVELFLNRDRRSYSNVCYVGRNNRAWQGNIGGVGWEDFGHYESGSTIEPTLQLKPWELLQIASCNVNGTGRNSPSITQQPNAANDWTVVWSIADPQDGASGYSVNINVVAR